MSDVTVTVDVDDKSLKRTLNELERKVQEGATEGLEDTLEQGEEAAISKLEQERRAYNSPHLRNSFTTNITGPDSSQTGTIHNPLDYAAYVDQGVSGTQTKRDTPFSYDSSKPPLDKMIEYVEQRMSSWNLDDDTPFGEGNFPLRLGGRGRFDDGSSDDDSPPEFYQPLDNYDLNSSYDKKRITDTDELEEDVDIYVDDGESIDRVTVEDIDDDGTLQLRGPTDYDEFNINDAEYDIIGRQSNPSIHELDTREEDGEGTEVIIEPEVGTYRDSTFYGEIEEELTREGVRVYRVDSYASNYNGEAIELDVVDDDLVGTRENNPEEWFEKVSDDKFANSLESIPDSHTRYDVTEENLELARKNDEQILIEWKDNEYLADVQLNNNSTLYEIDAGTTANGEEIKFVYETDTQTAYEYDGGTELDFVSLTGVTNKQATWSNLSEGDDILVDISGSAQFYELTEEFDFDVDQKYATINGVSENQQAYLRGSYEENFRDNSFVSAFRRNKNTELTYNAFIGTREDNPDKWSVKDLSIGDKVTGYTDSLGGKKKVTGRIKKERREYTSHGGEVRIVDSSGNEHTINDFDVTDTTEIDRVEEPPREPTLPEAYNSYEYDVLDDIDVDERFYAWLEGEKRFAKVERIGNKYKLVDEDESPSYYRREDNPYTLTLVGRKGYYKSIDDYDTVTSYKNTRVDDTDTLQGVDSVYFDTGEETIEAEIEDLNTARDIITVSHTKEVNGNTETKINLDAYENQIFRISKSNLEPSDIERDYYKELDRYSSKSARGKLYEDRPSTSGGDVEYRPQRIERTDDVFEGLRIAVDYGDETKYGNVTEIDKEKHIIKIDAGLGGTFIKLADPSEDGQIIGRKDKVYKQELTEGQQIVADALTGDILPEKLYGKYQQASDGSHEIKTPDGRVEEIQTIRYTKENEPEKWNEETNEPEPSEKDVDYTEDMNNGESLTYVGNAAEFDLQSADFSNTLAEDYTLDYRWTDLSDNPEEYDYEVGQRVIVKVERFGTEVIETRFVDDVTSDYVEFGESDTKRYNFADGIPNTIEPLGAKDVKSIRKLEEDDEILIDSSKFPDSSKVSAYDDKKIYAVVDSVEKTDNGRYVLEYHDVNGVHSGKIYNSSDEKLFATRDNYEHYWELQDKSDGIIRKSRVTVKADGGLIYDYEDDVVEGYITAYNGLENKYQLTPDGVDDDIRVTIPSQNQNRTTNIKNIREIDTTDTLQPPTLSDAPTLSFDELTPIDTQTQIRNNLEERDRVLVYDRKDDNVKTVKLSSIRNTINGRNYSFTEVDKNQDYVQKISSNSSPISYRDDDYPVEVLAKYPDDNNGLEEGSTIDNGSNEIWYGQKIEYKNKETGEEFTGIVRDWDEGNVYLSEDSPHDEIPRLPRYESNQVVTGGESWSSLSEDDKREQIRSEVLYRVDKEISTTGSEEAFADFVAEELYDALKDKDNVNGVVSNLVAFSDEKSGSALGSVNNASSNGLAADEYRMDIDNEETELRGSVKNTAFHEFTHALIYDNFTNASGQYSRRIIGSHDGESFEEEYPVVPYTPTGVVNQSKYDAITQDYSDKSEIPTTVPIPDLVIKEKDGSSIGSTTMAFDIDVDVPEVDEEKLASYEYNTDIDTAKLFNPNEDSVKLEAGDVIKINDLHDEIVYAVFTGRTDNTGGNFKYSVVSADKNTYLRLSDNPDDPLQGSDEFLGIAKGKEKEEWDIEKEQFKPNSKNSLNRYVETVNRVTREQLKAYEKDYDENGELGILSDRIAVERPYASSGSSELATGMAEIILSKNPETAYSLKKIYNTHPTLVETALEVYNPTDVVEELIREDIPELRDKL